MKKAFKIIGIIFAAVIVIAACLLFAMRDNIAAFIKAKNEKPEQILAQMQENDAELKKKLELQLNETYREYTEEEKRQIESGEASEKEILAKIISEKSAESSSSNPSANTSANPSPNSADTGAETYGPPAPPKDSASSQQRSDKIINKYVSRLYSMEGRYISSIEGVISRAYAEYVRTAKHNDDTAAMASVGAKYIGEIYSLEASCDSEVNSLLASMKSELDAIGADTSIIGTIRSAYNNEKQLKRSYYMGKYMR